MAGRCKFRVLEVSSFKFRERLTRAFYFVTEPRNFEIAARHLVT